MKTHLTALVVVLAAMVPAARGQAQDRLPALPDETAIVVRIASIDAVRDSSDAVFGLAPPRIQGEEFSADMVLGELLNVEDDLDVVRSDAPIYVAVFPVEEPQPVAYVVQTDDEKRLRGAVLRLRRGQEAEVEERGGGFVEARNGARVWYFGRSGDWAIYTPSEAVAEFFIAGGEGGFEIDDPRAADLFDGGLVSAVANVGLIVETFSDDIRETRRRMLGELEAAPTDPLAQGGVSGEAAIEMYREMLLWMFDAVRELRWAALRLEVGEQETALEGVLTVAEGGELDRLLADNPPSRLELLESLPAGAPAYFAMDVNMELIIPWARDLMERLLGDNEAVQDLLDSFDAFRGIGQVAGSFAPPPDAETGMVILELIAAEDPQALLEAYRAYFDAALALQEGAFEDAMIEYEQDAEEYRGTSIDLARQPSIDDGRPDPLLPAGGLEFRFAALEEVLAFASGNDPAIMERLIDAVEGEGETLESDDAFAAVREQLAEEANVLIVADIPQLFLGFMQMMAPGGPQPLGFQGETSYAGVSLGTEPQGLRLRGVVPTASLRLFLLGMTGRPVARVDYY